MNTGGVAVAVFAATALEMVEALTIVLAVGITSGWRVALAGAAVAVVILAIGISVGGATLLLAIPQRLLQVIAGVVLLWFGYQWLWKAMRRTSGRKAKRDEAKQFVELSGSLRSVETAGKRKDWIPFLTSFKGVLLEGFEAALFVVVIGSTGRQMTVAVAAASVAILLVVILGVLIHRPLTRVPENTLGYLVGVALVSFGIFWLGEGSGLHWVGGELALPVIALLVYVGSGAGVQILRRQSAG